MLIFFMPEADDGLPKVSVLIKFVSASYTPEIEILLLILYRYITNTLLFLYSDTLVLSCETLASGHLCVCISRCVDVSHTNPLVRGYGCLFVTITML